MADSYLGIDISKANFHAALYLEKKPTNKPKVKVFQNNPDGWEHLQTWLLQRGAGTIHACLEATSTYGEGVAEFLIEQGHLVSMVNPARIKGFAISELSRSKSDKADAQLIARFCMAVR
jgi:transposase